MKNILTIITVLICSFAFSQPGGSLTLVDLCPQKTIIPLRTFTDIPKDECYYMKDTDNELQEYEGTWVGNWNNKTLLITFKKITEKYDASRNYHKDYLIAKFKILDTNGNILFDNTSVSDDNAKIKGSSFAKTGAKAGPTIDIGGYYSLLYSDPSLCRLWGFVYIKFANPAKTQLLWKFNQRRQTIFPDCYYYNYPTTQYPKPLPNEDIILTKQ